jgi:hypothetical protein
VSATIALFLLAAVAWLAVARQQDVPRLLALSLGAYLFFWAMVPLGYVLFRPAHTGYPLHDPEYLRIAQLHLATLAASLALFALLPSRRWRPLMRWGSPELPEKLVYSGVAAAGIALAICEAWTLSITGWGYLASVQFAVRGSAADLSRKGMLDAVLVFLVGFAIVCAVQDWSRSQFRRRILLISWAMLLAHAAISITQGARAAVLLPLFVFLGRTWMVPDAGGWLRKWRTVILLGGACAVAGPLLIVVGLTRDLGETKMSTTVMSRAFAYTFASRSAADQFLLVADGFYVKFEHFRTGVTLLAHEGEARATWRPILSAVYSPIPRIIMPGKPVPLSRNGDVSGIPWRIAASGVGDLMSGAVVPVAPAAVALWEFGTLGLLLLVLVNVYHFIFVGTLLSSRSLIYQALGISLLSLPTTEFLFSGAAYLIRDDLRLGLYLLLLRGLIGAWGATQRLLHGGPGAARVSA